MTSKALLILAAIVEVATGLVLVSQPALFVRLLFGVEMSGAGLALGRLAGFGLFSLGVACWPLPTATLAALRAMLIYNFLATVYLAYLRFGSDLTGRLLLPAIALHGVLALLFVRAWFKHRSEEIKV